MGTCIVTAFHRNLDSVESVSIAALVDRLGRLSGERMREICAALAVAVGCDS